MRTKKRKLLLAEATPLMLFVLSLLFLVISVIAYSIAKPAGIALAIIPAGLFYFFIKYFSVQKSIKENPRVTNSRVVSKSKTENREGLGNKQSVYKLIVEFTPTKTSGMSETLRLELEVSSSIFNRYKESDLVSILYAQADPRFAMLKGEGQSWHSYWPELGDVSDKEAGVTTQIHDQIGHSKSKPLIAYSNLGVRKRGLVKLIIGILLTAALVTVTNLGIQYSTDHPRERSTYSNPDEDPIPLPLVTGFIALLTLSGAGFGVVELITGIPWNKARGILPFLILVMTWIVFILVLIGPNNLMREFKYIFGFETIFMPLM